MIIYIHGFGGSAKGVKASSLRKALKEHNILAPTLSYNPDLAIDTLEQIINSYKKYENIYLIGSSLGGFFSIYLAKKYNLKAVLINPATDPINILSTLVGQALNFGDLSKFEWNQNHVDTLKKYYVKDINPKNYMLLAQTGDEMIDYKIAKKELKGCIQIIEQGGNHGFENIEKYINDILNFFKK